ncbi:glycosyltransferase family 4 protein [Nocardioides sp.]|uniref:glycosyltransferase family 4 protein n=1 Tax=Nocardioides sp. TaxID=35761 RepID=UPI003517FC3A
MSGPRTGPLTGRRAAVVNWRDLGHSRAGGSEHYAWQAALALRDAGADVDFVTARDRTTGQSAREVVDGIDVVRGGGTLGFYPRALLWLLRHRRSIDLVIDPACGIPTFTPLVLPRRTTVLLVVHHVHQDQFGTYFPAPVAALGRWLERVAMPRVYRRRPVVAVSDSTRTEMRRRLGWRGDIGLLPNGAAQPDAGASPVPPGPPGPAGPPRLLVLGRLVPHKRVDLALAALAALRPAHPGLRLDVAGAGPELPALLARARELGVADAVTFHGFVSERRKAELLDAATLHLCGSDAEGWGQVVVEAAAHGLPTVARDVPGLRDSVRDGVTGWLVPATADTADTAAGFVATVDRALRELADPATRARVRAAARAHAAAYTWPRMHAQLLRHLSVTQPVTQPVTQFEGVTP